MTQDSRENTPDISKPIATFHNNDRLTFFSDGVFAITITLLVLEIKVPEIAEQLVASELPSQLIHLAPKILSHILSFVVLGLYWIAHHNMFIHVKRHDHVMLWLNILFLMCVASIPFPTGLLGQYPDLQLSVLIYAGVLAATGISLNLIWWYATTHQLIDKEVDAKFISFVYRYIRVAPVIYVLAIGTSFFSLLLSKLLLIAVTIFYIVPKPFNRKHYRQLMQRFEQ